MSEQDLRGRTVVLTGASAGIGAAAARRFAALGATVAVVGRSADKVAAIADEIGGRPHLVDYGRFDDVRRLAQELLDAYPRIDVLANNAGGIYTHRQTSADGHEMTMQVNLYSPFLLTTLLLDRLIAAPTGARIVNTTSSVYRSGRLAPDNLEGHDRRTVAYPASKLGVMLVTAELARRLVGTRVTVYSFHPGMVRTDIGRDTAIIKHIMRWPVFDHILTPASEAAVPLITLATDPPVPSGGYLQRNRPRAVTGPATDPALARRLWDRLTEITDAYSGRVDP